MTEPCGTAIDSDLMFKTISSTSPIVKKSVYSVFFVLLSLANVPF